MTSLVRCAIYTRKSVDERLEQPFTSLDAQREACAAYVKSQAGGGWVDIQRRYDDGGYSGANSERPALKQLLADVEQGLIDIVVVYKLDRLTRSLADFARIVERFEKAKVGFVAVTQSFNTADAVGRLTLNILLTFAQFERELISDRIKDKIAASRAKGFHMGSFVPIGYQVKQRRLAIVPAQARVVHLIFRKYLELRSVKAVREELSRRRIKPHGYVTRFSRVARAEGWTNNTVSGVLRNRHYLGHSVHRGRSYPGQHEAIVEEGVFNQAQALLKEGARAWHLKRTIGSWALLTGLIFDDNGHCMTPFRQGNSRAYISEAIRKKKEAGSVRRARMVDIDQLVLRCVKSLSKDRNKGPMGLEHEDRRQLRATVTRVQVGADIVRIWLRSTDPVGKMTDALRREFPDATVAMEGERVVALLPVNLQPIGYRWRIEGSNLPEGMAVSPQAATPLLKALARAHHWRWLLERNEVTSIEGIAALESESPLAVMRTLQLAFLAPDIQRSIVEGQLPTRLAQWPHRAPLLPLDWREQRQLLGASPAARKPAKATA